NLELKRLSLRLEIHSQCVVLFHQLVVSPDEAPILMIIDGYVAQASLDLIGLPINVFQFRLYRIQSLILCIQRITATLKLLTQPVSGCALTAHATRLAGIGSWAICFSRWRSRQRTTRVLNLIA